MKELTRAEEQIMRALWQLEKAQVKELIQHLPDPKPAYNTVSTIVRILEQKGFVDHKPLGKGYEYFPLVSKETYTQGFMKGFVSRYFSGSFEQMVSFFAKKEDLSLEELEKLLQELKDEKS